MNLDSNDALKRGVAAHQAGDLAAAAALYGRILEISPDHADANHLLGLVFFQNGDIAQASALIRRAIGSDAAVALYHANLGRVLKAAGDDAGAAAAFGDAVRLQPDDAVLLADLASAMIGTGDFDAARGHAESALALDPDLAEAHLNLGLAIQEIQGAASADAVLAFRRALTLNPALAGAHLGLGVALHEAGDGVQAGDAYRRALALDPGFVEAHCNLGNLLRDACDFAGAVAHYRAALVRNAEQSAVWGNLAVVLQETGALPDAIAAYDRAIQLAPDDPEIRRNRGMALLAAGRFEAGWRDYEYRWRTQRFQALTRDWPVPQWDGSEVMGRRILVHAEQGLGDTLQFCRYLPLLAAAGARVTVECSDGLARLLGGMPGVEAVVAPGAALPEIDLHVPMLSLPGLFKTTAESVPAKVPYLAAPAEATRKWRNFAVGWPAGRRIGIAWRGSPDHARDALRSPGLAPFMALARIAAVRLVSLQKQGGAAELTATPGAEVMIDPMRDVHDFADTAALINELDAVVSCDSAPLHLAGALGVPVVAVLPHVAEWRWGGVGERTPWYPTMTLVRQPAFGDWAGALARVKAIL